jgi:hypothetical protein
MPIWIMEAFPVLMKSGARRMVICLSNAPSDYYTVSGTERATKNGRRRMRSPLSL